MGWIQYLLYIMSFIVPPVGVVSLWVFLGREDEISKIGKWAFFAAFLGFIGWIIFAAVTGSMFHGLSNGIRRY